ncbi:MAG: 2OG-Fe(II) oxygenase [Bacteroidetes bacterium]|nr:2OG-Fe(II) oxygenase [Bacteroidota bacterium]
MNLRQIDTNIFTIENFLSHSTCEEYILYSEQRGFEEAKVSIDGEQRMMKSIRNNSRILFTDSGLADKLWNTVNPFVVKKYGNSVAVGLNEMFRFYKYEPGQRFKRHRDGNYIRNEREASFFTLMIYLNSNFKGGSTRFENAAIKPETGMALIFEHSLMHEGTPVEEGVKYVLRTDIMYRMPL